MSERRVRRSELQPVVMFLFKTIQWFFARLVVIIAIGVAVSWGGLFHEPFELVRGTISWILVWAGIDYYRWHVGRYET